MTRLEFNRQFAASENNTEGFSLAQLAALNDVVFDVTAHLDLDDRNAKSAIGDAFAWACCDYKIVNLASEA